MATNNGNGYPPKVELNKVGQEVKLRILRPVKIGTGKNPYYLYRVLDVDSLEEKSLFAPADIFSLIEEQKLGFPGSEFLLKRIASGRNGGSLELSILTKAEPPSKPTDDTIKSLLLESIKIVQEAVSESKIQFSNDAIQDLISTIFIQKTKQ